MIRQRLPALELFIAAAVLTARPDAAMAAEPAARKANLEVVAPPGCATNRELEERVRRRAERVRFVQPGPGVRRARAELRRTGTREVRARLVWWSEGGRELVRELSAPNCRDAIDALAVVLAVALDPAHEPSGEEGAGEVTTDGARASAAFAGDAQAREENAGDGDTDARRPARSESVDDGEPFADPEVDETGRDDLRRTEAGPRGAPWRVSPFAGLAGGVRSGPAPALLPGLGLFVGFDVNWGLPDSGLVRVVWSRHRRDELDVDGGTAAFELDTLRLDLCPLGLTTAPFAVHGCFAAELGVLEAQGEANAQTRSRERPWRSFGGALLVALRPRPFLELELMAALERPLVRDRFEFEPRTFHEVSSLAGRLELALGVRIP